MVQEGEEGGGKGEGEVVGSLVGQGSPDGCDGRDTVSDKGGEEAVVSRGSSCLNDSSKPDRNEAGMIG